ncbi:MAG: hypothetical protein ACLU80_04150 [Dorea sp.]
MRQRKNAKQSCDEVDLAQMSLFDTVKDDDVIKEIKELDISQSDADRCIEYTVSVRMLQNRLAKRKGEKTMRTNSDVRPDYN